MYAEEFTEFESLTEEEVKKHFQNAPNNIFILKFYFHTFCLFDTVYFTVIVSLCLCVTCVTIVCCFHQLLDIIIGMC